MKPDQQAILDIAEILSDSLAMTQAALAGEFDEVRFRAQLIAGKAAAAGHRDLAIAAACTMDRLGAVGSSPRNGYGAGMLRMAKELDKLRFEPPQ